MKGTRTETRQCGAHVVAHKTILPTLAITVLGPHCLAAHGILVCRLLPPSSSDFPLNQTSPERFQPFTCTAFPSQGSVGWCDVDGGSLRALTWADEQQIQTPLRGLLPWRRFYVAVTFFPSKTLSLFIAPHSPSLRLRSWLWLSLSEFFCSLNSGRAIQVSGTVAIHYLIQKSESLPVYLSFIFFIFPNFYISHAQYLYDLILPGSSLPDSNLSI